MIKKNDCVRIEYNAYVKEDNKLFDTTDKKEAEDNNIFQKNAKYEPVSVIVGKGFVVKGVDESLVGKKVGDSYKLEVLSEKGFGKWSSKLTENIKINSFKKQNVNPQKGMIINIGGRLGRVALVIPGRFVKVDYNHPLAGKDLIYKIKIVDKTSKVEDKVETITGFLIGDAGVKVEGKKIIIKPEKEVPGNVKSLVKKMIEETLKKGYNLTFK